MLNGIAGELRRAPQAQREVLDQWWGHDSTYFKMRANDGNLYILRQRVPVDAWVLESFRREQC